jgi:murein endopeptidase
MLATLTRLRAIGLASALVALAATAASLEPATGGRPVLAPASLFAVKSASAQPSRSAPAPEAEPMLLASAEPLPEPSSPLALPPRDARLPTIAIPEEPPVAETVAPTRSLDVVRWTVDRRMRIGEVAMNWGLWVDELREMNPELRRDQWIDAGTALVVHRKDPRHPTQSVGAPNKGHLLGGIPLPEGPHWLLREHRPRAYGSANTIRALLEAFAAYGAADPAAPPVRVGEISKRSGGRIAPHASHRTGRDVDIGFVMKQNPGPDERFWRVATGKNIDAARTWAMISALIATGEVQQIFISAKLQPIIAKEAAKTLAPEDVALVFSSMNPDPSVHTIVKHETGHRDHMHVRFVCEPGNLRCRAQSREN